MRLRFVIKIAVVFVGLAALGSLALVLRWDLGAQAALAIVRAVFFAVLAISACIAWHWLFQPRVKPIVQENCAPEPVTGRSGNEPFCCSSRCIKYAILWLVLAITIAIGIGSQYWATYRRLAERGVSETATVVELLPQFHNTVRYEYHVAGETFQGRWGSRPPNPPSESLAIGQSVVIYYDPEHPEVSVLGDPKLMLKDESLPIMLAALLLPTFIVFVLARKEYERKKMASPQITPKG